jgi:hypothetical protein
MIALLASVLLGLYVFVPYIVFHRCCSFFIRLKEFQRSKTDEIVVGVVVAGLPFLLTLILFWGGHISGSIVPFPLVDSQQQKTADYHTVFTGAYSDHYFTDHQPETWAAFKRVCKRQVDFIAWNYGFVLVETGIFVGLVRQYGKWKDHKFYRWLASRVLLPAVSEWHVLLTDFNFPARENRSVEVDALSKDNILYRGSVVEHFLGVKGELSGLLLKNAQRFQYDKLIEDRKSKLNFEKTNEQYWKLIPGGGNFYLPGDNIASLNIRYPLPKAEQELFIKDLVARLFNGAKVEPIIIPTPEELQAGEILFPGVKKTEED